MPAEHACFVFICKSDAIDGMKLWSKFNYLRFCNGCCWLFMIHLEVHVFFFYRKRNEKNLKVANQHFLRYTQMYLPHYKMSCIKMITALGISRNLNRIKVFFNYFYFLISSFSVVNRIHHSLNSNSSIYLCLRTLVAFFNIS